MENAISLEGDYMLIGLILALAVLGGLGICYANDAFYGFAWLWLFPASLAGLFILGLALAFGFLCLASRLARTDKTQEEDSRFYRGLVNLYIDAAIPLVGARIKAYGLEKTPKDGRFLLVCNHLHEADPVVLLHYFKKSQLAFIAKKESSTMFLVGKIMPKLMCQYVNRENDREALKTIIKCIQLLKDDKVSVGVFPEGYIREDRKFHHFRPGVFKIAQKANVPIVVCTLRNTQYILPNFLKGKPTDVELHLLEVISEEEIQGKTTVEIADRIYNLMAEDLGPEAVLAADE